MKKPKRIPVNIPLENNGSISDVFQDFINKMQIITGGNVDLDCDLQGNITVYFEGDNAPSISNKSYNIEELLYPEVIGRIEEIKINESMDLAMQNNVTPDVGYVTTVRAK